MPLLIPMLTSAAERGSETVISPESYTGSPAVVGLVASWPCMAPVYRLTS